MLSIGLNFMSQLQCEDEKSDSLPLVEHDDEQEKVDAFRYTNSLSFGFGNVTLISAYDVSMPFLSEEQTVHQMFLNHVAHGMQSLSVAHFTSCG